MNAAGPFEDGLSDDCSDDFSDAPLSDDRLFEDFLTTLPRVGAIAGPVFVAQAAHPVLRRVRAGPRLDRRGGPAIVRACRPRSSLSAPSSLRTRPGMVSSPT